MCRTIGCSAPILPGRSTRPGSMGRRSGCCSRPKATSPALPMPNFPQWRADMSFNKPVRRVAIVGIGASWAAQYLARGFDVIATDPAPNAEASLRKYIDEAWPALTEIGLSSGASRDPLSFTTNMKEALSQADLVQENGPERPDFKIKLFADMDAAAPVDSIIASSSSGITPSVMQWRCAHPDRVLVGHPFNPPHVIPLVEVVGGARTSEEAVRRAMAFYTSIG